MDGVACGMWTSLLGPRVTCKAALLMASRLAQLLKFGRQPIDVELLSQPALQLLLLRAAIGAIK